MGIIAIGTLCGLWMFSFPLAILGHRLIPLPWLVTLVRIYCLICIMFGSWFIWEISK